VPWLPGLAASPARVSPGWRGPEASSCALVWSNVEASAPLLHADCLTPLRSACAFPLVPPSLAAPRVARWSDPAGPRAFPTGAWIARWTPHCSAQVRQEAAEARTRSRVLPWSPCSGLRPRGPRRCLAESARADPACQRPEPVRVSHAHGSGFLEWFSLAGPHRSNNFRGSRETLLTCSTRFLTCVSARQRGLLPGGWLAFALGRTCTSWRTSTDFIEVASLESHQ
jgi:hypothetical protein